MHKYLKNSYPDFIYFLKTGRLYSANERFKTSKSRFIGIYGNLSAAMSV